MIQIIAGKKGSGKTKRLIDMTNETAKVAANDVIFIDKDNSFMMDVDHKVRFVNATEYRVSSAEMFIGFLCGMLSQNYDIGTIFIDAFIKLVKIDMADAEWFFSILTEMSEKHSVNFVLSVSADPAELPAYAKEYVI